MTRHQPSRSIAPSLYTNTVPFSVIACAFEICWEFQACTAKSLNGVLWFASYWIIHHVMNGLQINSYACNSIYKMCQMKLVWLSRVSNGCKVQEGEEKITAKILKEARKQTEDVEAENNLFAAHERLQQQTVILYPDSSVGNFQAFVCLYVDHTRVWCMWNGEE